MSATGWLVVAALVGCLGVWFVFTGLAQPRPALERAIRHLRREPIPHAVAPSGGTLLARSGRVIASTGAGRRADGWSEMLRVIDRPLDVHLGLLALASAIGFLAPFVTLVTARAFGLAQPGWFVPVGFALLGAVAAPLVVHGRAVDRAADVRRDLRHQLSAYLDVVSMLLAGNTGYEGALDQGAHAGDGLLFRQLRRRMREVGATGSSLVEALAIVGDDYGIVELEQVAATASLSAAEGAPVARALAAKCATLRSTLATDDEAAARVRNDKLTPPLVGMALLFMVLIIYPALTLS
jgi:hypothetical protein